MFNSFRNLLPRNRPPVVYSFTNPRSFIVPMTTFYSYDFTHFYDDTLNETVDILIDELLEVVGGDSSMEDVLVTISDDEFSRLPECKWGTRVSQKECSVCLEDFVSDEILKVLPKCNHMFHPKCIQNWLTKQKTTCPVCRVDVRTNETEQLN